MRSFVSTLVTVVILGAAAPALAQCPEDQRIRVQRELEVTEVRLDQARDVVARGDVEAARIELAAAVETQARARVEFGAGRCRIAMDLTLRARFRATRAVELVRGSRQPGLPDPGRVLTELERTRDLLERARDRIEECENLRARGLLSAALEMQRRAEEAVAQDRPLAAFQLTASARERGLRALRLCNMHDDLRESAERALHRTDTVLGRVRDRLADRPNERAERALGRAVDLQERAQVEFRAGRFEAALRLTVSARTTANRALRLAGGTP